MDTSIPVGTNFLVQSSTQANVLTLPRLYYQQVNAQPLHTIQVQSLTWVLNRWRESLLHNSIRTM